MRKGNNATNDCIAWGRNIPFPLPCGQIVRNMWVQGAKWTIRGGSAILRILARLAGVSPGTVSRALANSPLIAKKTREQIQELAREHDFRPNVMARNLRIKRAGAIGVLIPLGHETGQHISDPFFMTMLGHLADALTERGHDFCCRA